VELGEAALVSERFTVRALSFSLRPRDLVSGTTGGSSPRDDETAGCGAEVTTDARHRPRAFLLVHDAATEGLRVDDEVRTDIWRADPMGRFHDRYPDGPAWADQTWSECEATTDPLSAPAHPTSAAVAIDAPIAWRAAPLLTTDSTAALAADPPISWRAASPPITESSAAPFDDPAPGAADGIAPSNEPPEPTSRGAHARRGAGTTDTKRHWPIFYGLVAVLVVVDVIVVWLAYRA
jgi:hypothetical protein